MRQRGYINRKSIGKIGIIVFLFIAQSLFAQENFPQRIISLGPSITKALYLLGVQDKLIANTVYCIDPPEAKKKEKIGTAQKVNIEEVFNLKPDLVLATSLVDPRSTEKLKTLGLRVVTFSTPKDFNDICKQFLELSRLVGKEKEAKEIVRKAENEAALIREKVKNLYKPKVLIQVGARPLVVATGNYFINDYIEFAGGINIAEDAKEGIYSREQVLKANPDVIIITTMGIATEEEKRIWQKYGILNAAKFNQIYIIDTDKITSPTPQSFIQAIEEFVYILHPGK
jgi:iron complex transport system substrate-binding protein